MDKSSKDRVNQLERLLSDFTEIKRNEYGDVVNEDKFKIIKQYSEYISLSPNQKQSLREDWDNYLLKCKDTKAAKRWSAQGKAFKNKNYGLVVEFGKKARDQQENNDFELQKPYLEDPIFLESHGYVRQYLRLIYLIDQQGVDSESDRVLKAIS